MGTHFWGWPLTLKVYQVEPQVATSCSGRLWMMYTYSISLHITSIAVLQLLIRMQGVFKNTFADVLISNKFQGDWMSFRTGSKGE